tara:strand:+ start:132 stop:908 length:777 start_codon:yes stop_codon:yes gene_type:complete
MKNTQLKNYIDKGFCIVKLFKKKDIINIKKLLTKKLKLLDKKNLLKSLNVDNLDEYHNFNLTDEYHKNLLKTSTRYIKLGINQNNIIKKLNILNLLMLKNWGHNKSSLFWVGSLKDKNYKSNVIGFRISRPKESKPKDATGVHVDLHVGGKICNDRNVLISIWIPIIGFSHKYSLKIAPKSHTYHHPIKSFIKSKTVTNIFSDRYIKKFSFIRPNLKIGQAIIFHPNLLHGNSFNLGNKTRFSLEARLYNKKNMSLWF